MEPQYDHKKHEEKIYKLWEKGGYFKPSKKGKPFTILMPPPNANASLHAGHAMYTIDDIVIRWKRMQGYSALWQPGVDHAGIETQYVYERTLSKIGKSRLDFDRDTLYQNIWDFVQENSGLIFEQFKRLGFSADWDQSLFTLDKKVVSYVYKTFKQMVKDDYVYRDEYMVNYCVHCGTSLAELEVKHIERIDTLYYVRYPLVAKNSREPNYVEVATVRPEPIYIDSHLAVHPKDKKNKWLIGRKVLNPITNDEMEIIADEFVDPKFGTGVVKLTPGHDPKDFEVAKKHKLPIIQAIGLDGKMLGGKNKSKSVKFAREQTVEELKEKGLINEKKTDPIYSHSVSVCYKCGRDLEPLSIPNWFIKVEDLKKSVQKAVKNNEVKFYPKRFKGHMLQWLETMHDWPISRQIVWGIRIPAWYNIDENPSLKVTFLNSKNEVVTGFVSELMQHYSLKEIRLGLQSLIAPKGAEFKISETKLGGNYLQETDTFDTWFSSGQWPLVTLLVNDHKDRLPTDFIGTLSDILKFWISRMVMFSLYRENKIPYKDVYLWSMVADEKGIKMSKSKGNVVNPIDLVEKYGSDSLRMTLVFGVAPGSKIPLSDDKVRGMRNFSNKIWNMARFMQLMFDDVSKEVPFFDKGKSTELKPEDRKIIKELEATINSVDESLLKYRFSDAAETIYHFTWEALASDYLEKIKARQDKELALSVFRHVFLTSLKLLHPFMPFVTEAIWQELKDLRKHPGELLITAEWPEAK